jgi:hypothetical protein
MTKKPDQDSDEKSRNEIDAANQKRRLLEELERIRGSQPDLKSKTKDDVDPPEDDD